METDSLKCDGQKGMRKVLREAHKIVHGVSHPRQHDKLANLMLDFLGVTNLEQTLTQPLDGSSRTGTHITGKCIKPDSNSCSSLKYGREKI
jgi:hypothetical protein